MSVTLNTYLMRVRQLTHDVHEAQFNNEFIVSYINTARGQIAGMGKAIRDLAALNWPANAPFQRFSAIVPATAGVDGILNVNTILCAYASGLSYIRPRPWPWFLLYELNNPLPQPGAPVVWSQQGQGTAGTIYVSPIADADLAMTLDVICKPADLIDNASIEALPYPWTDAVPFMAAWYVYQEAQMDARAEQMRARAEQFMQTARRMSTAETQPGVYSQVPDPAMFNKFGIAPQGDRQ